MRFHGAISGARRLRMTLPVGLAALLATLAGACNCGMPEGDYWGHVPENPDPTHLRWCNSGEPQYLDPALTTSTTGVKLVYAVWDGLTRHDLNGLPEPSVATDWVIDPDLRRFRFNLRKDARWSNGRPLNAHDFAYHIIRILHPSTGSSNTDPHWKLKNGKLFTSSTLRILVRDSGPFKKGDIVEVIESKAGPSDPNGSRTDSERLSDSNARRAASALHLRDFPGFWDWCTGDCVKMKEPYRTVPAGTTVNVVDLQTDKEGTEWAYVYWLEGQGVYGWVKSSEIPVQPHGDTVYQVKARPRNAIPGLDLTREELATIAGEKLTEGTITAADAMMLPVAVGLRVPDDHTLVLETEDPIPYFIDLTPQRAYRPSPREGVSRRPQRWSQPAFHISSGPYSMTEWHIRDYIRLKKSNTYWDAAHTRLETITAYSMNDQAASANYYFQGGCDAITGNNLPAAYYPIVDGTMRGGRAYKDYTKEAFLGIYLYLINTEKVTNVHMRRALSMAVNRTRIPRFLRGGQIDSAQLMIGTKPESLSDADLAACGITRDHPGLAAVMISGELCYVPPPGVGYDPEGARKELALAKAEMGNKFKKSFSVKYNSGVEQHKMIAEFLQDQWKNNLGLNVSLESQEWKTFLADTKNGEYEIARMGWIMNFMDVEAELLPTFRCGAPDNRSRWCNDEFEALMKKAEATFDRKERLEIIKQAESILVQDVPVIPLYVYTQHHLQKPYVKDLAINVMDQVPFEKAWIDPNWREHLAEPQAKAK
jgi:oligopeptide transport system substrate-binding protein